jgi:hypothetical protein
MLNAGTCCEECSNTERSTSSTLMFIWLAQIFYQTTNGVLLNYGGMECLCGAKMGQIRACALRHSGDFLLDI